MSSFPIPAPAFDGRSRVVGVSAVFDWLRIGWGVFMINPGLWMLSALIVGFLMLAALWFVGPLAGFLLPVLAAGPLGMCRRAAGEKDFGLSDLTAGFSMRPGPLMLLGVIFILASFAVEGLALVLLGSSIHTVGHSVLAGWFLFFGGLILGFLLPIPLLMVMWFAPALILFNGMSPVGACKASFMACLKNILPLAVLGLIAFILCFFAAMPLGLGFLVLIPVLAGTAYASYQDVFVIH